MELLHFNKQSDETYFDNLPHDLSLEILDILDILDRTKDQKNLLGFLDDSVSKQFLIRYHTQDYRDITEVNKDKLDKLSWKTFVKYYLKWLIKDRKEDKKDYKMREICCKEKKNHEYDKDWINPIYDYYEKHMQSSDRALKYIFYKLKDNQIYRDILIETIVATLTEDTFYRRNFVNYLFKDNCTIFHEHISIMKLYYHKWKFESRRTSHDTEIKKLYKFSDYYDGMQVIECGYHPRFIHDGCELCKVKPFDLYEELDEYSINNFPCLLTFTYYVDSICHGIKRDTNTEKILILKMCSEYNFNKKFLENLIENNEKLTNMYFHN